MRHFGAAFGTAYQVYDDCVDLFGSESSAGKSLGTDLAKGKLTWPVLLAWERANVTDRAQLENLVMDWQPANFSAVNELLDKYETFEPTRRSSAGFWSRPAGPWAVCQSRRTHGPVQLADFLAQQTEALAVCVKYP